MITSIAPVIDDPASGPLCSEVEWITAPARWCRRTAHTPNARDRDIGFHRGPANRRLNHSLTVGASGSSSGPADTTLSRATEPNISTYSGMVIHPSSSAVL